MSGEEFFLVHFVILHKYIHVICPGDIKYVIYLFIFASIYATFTPMQEIMQKRNPQARDEH